MVVTPLPGDSSPWGLLSLGTPLPGDSPPWGLPSLGTPLPGDSSPWRLAALVFLSRPQWQDAGEALLSFFLRFHRFCEILVESEVTDSIYSLDHRFECSYENYYL